MKNKKYAELPWSYEDTIENMKDVKEVLQGIAKKANCDGSGKQDAQEIAFDFDRAIEALYKQIPQKVTTTKADFDTKVLNTVFGKGVTVHKCANGHYVSRVCKYCPDCGQRLDWSESDENN